VARALAPDGGARLLTALAAFLSTPGCLRGDRVARHRRRAAAGRRARDDRGAGQPARRGRPAGGGDGGAGRVDDLAALLRRIRPFRELGRETGWMAAANAGSSRPRLRLMARTRRAAGPSAGRWYRPPPRPKVRPLRRARH
jgi:hypothetical protein